MKKLKKLSQMGVLLASLNCTSKQDCSVIGTNDDEEVYSDIAVAKLCSRNRDLYFKCIIDDGHKDLYVEEIDCSSSKVDDQIANRLSNKDTVVCRGNTDPDAIVAKCD